jgi:hypothetical protein
MKKKHFIFIIKNNNKNRKHIKIKNKKDKSFLKKLKHEPGLKKTGDFTMSEGHKYPLIYINDAYGHIYTIWFLVFTSKTYNFYFYFFHIMGSANHLPPNA